MRTLNLNLVGAVMRIALALQGQGGRWTRKLWRLQQQQSLRWGDATSDKGGAMTRAGFVRMTVELTKGQGTAGPMAEARETCPQLEAIQLIDLS